VVFKELGKSGVKLIDFGSACFHSRKEFTYIQSRYYRSPEIVLMKPYDHKIDVWSLGCLIFEIYTGTPLFPSRTEDEQMQMLLATLGAPPQHFLGASSILFRNANAPRNSTSRAGRASTPRCRFGRD
jgi:dual specificity tyrosine-phosphorylation-regulated kinase 2/3/4